MTFISYAQNYEDVMLWRALQHIENGFYVDVGANDPTVDSVTKAFYERGWRGINLEPVQLYYERLCNERPLDINLPVAVADTEGDLIFYEIPETGLSTLDKATAEQHRQGGWDIDERKISVLTLDKTFEEYVNGPIHFLKIDVEGAEKKVLQGLDLSRWRPWIVVIEATKPGSKEVDFFTWEPLLTSQEYEIVYFDGLNRFYVANEISPLKKSFKTPPNVFDNFVTRKHWKIRDTLSQLDKVRYDREELQKQLDRLRDVREEIQNRLDSVWNEREKIRKRLDRVWSNREELRKQLDQAWVDFDKTQQQLKAVKIERNQTQIQLEQAKANQEQIQTQLNQVLIEKEETRKQLEQAKANQERIQTQLVQVITEKEEAYKQLEQAKANQERIQTQLVQVITEKEEAYKQLEQAKANQERIQTQLDEVWVDRERIQASLAEVLVDRERIQKEFDEVWIGRHKHWSELDTIYRSHSWKLLAPARRLFRWGRFWRDRINRIIHRPFSYSLAKILYWIKMLLERGSWGERLFSRIKVSYPSFWHRVADWSKHSTKTQVALVPSPKIDSDDEQISRDEKYFTELFQRELSNRQKEC